MILKRADEVDLGDTIDGNHVTGWYFGAKGTVWIEYANRWHRYHPAARVVTPIEPKEIPE